MQRAFVLGIATCWFQLLLYCTSFVMEQRVVSPSLRRETFSKFPSVYADLVDVGFEENQLHPDVDESFVRARFFMPSVVEKVLIDQEVESVNALDLLSRVDLSHKHRELALEALISKTPQCINVPMLNENECKKLKAFVNSRIIFIYFSIWVCSWLYWTNFSNYNITIFNSGFFFYITFAI